MSEEISFKRERDEQDDTSDVHRDAGNREPKRVKTEDQNSIQDGELVNNNASETNIAISQDGMKFEGLIKSEGISKSESVIKSEGFINSESVIKSEGIITSKNVVVMQPPDAIPGDDGAKESPTLVASPSVAAEPDPLLVVQVNGADVVQTPVEEKTLKEPTPFGEEPSMDPAYGLNRTERSLSGPPVLDVNPHKPPDSISAPTLSNPNSIVEERAEISAQYVGKVIGKGGEMLRDLQARSGCRLDVDQNVPHGNPRILTYRGTRKKVDLAKQMVSTLCTPQGNETTLPLGSATRKDLVVPASSVGKIIGRSGEMVRELQSRSQAKIQVDHTAKVYKADTRLVSIVGTPDAVVKAEEMVMFLVANPLMDAMKAIRMLVDDKVQRGGRWGSGPPYVNMPNQGYNMTPLDSGFNQPPPPQQYGGYHQAGPPPGHAFGVPPLQHGFGGYSERGPETEYFPAAKMYMGRIIGQKGITINDLQKRSGCDIQINQDVPAGQDCIVTIKGSRQKIEMAKQMLREIIEMGPNHPYAGGGGQYGGDSSHNYLQQGQPNQYMQQQVQVPMHGGYQQIGHVHGQLQYGGHSQPYSHNPPTQQYAQPVVPYGMSPYQSTPVYTQHAVPAYGAPPQQHLPPQSMGVPVSFGWKSATAADGQVYYYNEKTGETQWDKPAGMP